MLARLRLPPAIDNTIIVSVVSDYHLPSAVLVAATFARATATIAATAASAGIRDPVATSTTATAAIPATPNLAAIAAIATTTDAATVGGGMLLPISATTSYQTSAVS